MSEIRKPYSGSCLVVAFSILLALLFLVVICDLAILSNLSSQSSSISTATRPFFFSSTGTKTNPLASTPLIPVNEALQLPSPLPSPSLGSDEQKRKMDSSNPVIPPPPALEEEDEEGESSMESNPSTEQYIELQATESPPEGEEDEETGMDSSTEQQLPSKESPPEVEEDEETNMDSPTEQHSDLQTTQPLTDSPPEVEEEGEMSMDSNTEQHLQFTTKTSTKSPPAVEEEGESNMDSSTEQHLQLQKSTKPPRAVEEEGETGMDSYSTSILLKQKEDHTHPLETSNSLPSSTERDEREMNENSTYDDKAEQQDEPRIANIIPDNPTKAQPLFNITPKSPDFDRKVQEFLNQKSCKTHFFMNRLSPAPLFIKRDMMAVDSLFKTNPHGCLILFSDIMGSPKGRKILKPITDLGFQILVIPPDYLTLLSGTPALNWYKELQKGNIDPGEVHISHNLSDLLRLLYLYKYGGVYIDTDFVILKDFSTLRNTVGGQDIDPETGEWTLNGAAMIFDKGHPMVMEFINEFVTNFNGSLWGFQGPELVTRVIARVTERNGGLVIDGHKFKVLPEIAFYPISWTRASDLFARPNDTAEAKLTRKLTAQFKARSYGVHFWNQMSQDLKIMKGSIISRLYNAHCIVCKYA